MSEEQYNEIQDFLDGKFTNARAQEFRQAVANNEQLASDVAFVRLEREMQDALLDDEFSAQMKEWQKEKDGLPDPPPDDFSPKKNGGNRYWLLFLLPLAVACICWLKSQPSEPTQVPNPSAEATEEVAEPPVDPQTPNPPIEANEPPAQPNQPEKKTTPKQDRPIAQTGPSGAELLAMINEHDLQMGYIPQGVRGSAARQLAEAENARNAGRYDEAATIYKKVAEEKSEEGTDAAMNLGLLYFNLKKYGEAVPYFKKVAGTSYADDAQYYMALCYVANRQFGEATTLLEDLIVRDGFVREADRKKAEGLLEKLREIK